ncbi:pentapeptide repeat-containing protein [Streptomyces tauricus]|uniref:pentapeptide repeat-containing protein n=1 Tax=Streptomyces tauricus TaxID=68274 RepID=UPI00224323B4|nr:pentapeptide repeat-containing protein [Streptomyces tauricus]MCW8102658.1 pentapeptide repeat-containing protein [Streptomyces tauricus]
MTELDQCRSRVRQKALNGRRATTALMVAGAFVLFVVLPWLIWWGPYVIGPDPIDKAEAKKGSAALVTGLRTAVVAFTAALGAGIALLYTARTYRLTHRGQITDRFTKALERLGSGEIYVRIGGILALEQIVQDAPEQAATDAAHVLGHFIRHRAPHTVPPPDLDDPHRGPHADPLPLKPAADVQAALTALTRRESRTHVDRRERLDLNGLHLAGVQLNEADLTGANLSGATFTGAYLYKATFTEANLNMATFAGAHLHKATFTEANLPRATFTEATLSGATFTEAYLRRATFTEALLHKAICTGANLREAIFTETHLVGAAFTEANLREATFTEANLSATDLSSARRLTLGQIISAVPDEETKLPACFYASVGVPGT